MISTFSQSGVLIVGLEVIDLVKGHDFIENITVNSGKILTSRYVETLREIREEKLAEDYQAREPKLRGPIDPSDTPTEDYIAIVERWISATTIHEKVYKTLRTSPFAEEILDAAMIGETPQKSSVEGLRNEAAQLVAECLCLSLNEKLWEV